MNQLQLKLKFFQNILFSIVNITGTYLAKNVLFQISDDQQDTFLFTHDETPSINFTATLYNNDEPILIKKFRIVKFSQTYTFRGIDMEISVTSLKTSFKPKLYLNFSFLTLQNCPQIQISDNCRKFYLENYNQHIIPIFSDIKIIIQLEDNIHTISAQINCGMYSLYLNNNIRYFFNLTDLKSKKTMQQKLRTPYNTFYTSQTVQDIIIKNTYQNIFLPPNSIQLAANASQNYSDSDLQFIFQDGKFKKNQHNKIEQEEKTQYNKIKEMRMTNTVVDVYKSSLEQNNQKNYHQEQQLTNQNSSNSDGKQINNDLEANDSSAVEVNQQVLVQQIRTQQNSNFQNKEVEKRVDENEEIHKYNSQDQTSNIMSKQHQEQKLMEKQQDLTWNIQAENLNSLKNKQEQLLQSQNSLVQQFITTQQSLEQNSQKLEKDVQLLNQQEKNIRIENQCKELKLQQYQKLNLQESIVDENNLQTKSVINTNKSIQKQKQSIKTPDILVSLEDFKQKPKIMLSPHSGLSSQAELTQLPSNQLVQKSNRTKTKSQLNKNKVEYVIEPVDQDFQNLINQLELGDTDSIIQFQYQNQNNQQPKKKERSLNLDYLNQNISQNLTDSKNLQKKQAEFINYSKKFIFK